MLTKELLRSKILPNLRKQKKQIRLEKSQKIKDKLFKLKIFKKAKRVMFYMAFDGEVETKEMIRQAMRMGKIVAVPVCDPKERKIIPCQIGPRTKFKRGPYGIKEPLKKMPLPSEELDLVIVPGVAFDRKGNRLGRGKGYYDSFLKTLPKKTYSIGLAFDFQIVRSLPVLPHDIKVKDILFA